MGKEPGRRRRHRPDRTTRPPAATSRSPASSARPRVEALDDAGHDVGRHRRRRHRQGARHVRGRDDARAVPRRRARRGRQADAARAHRRLGRRLDRARRRQPRRRRASTSGCSPSRSRSSPRATRCGRSRCRIPFQPPLVAGAGGYFAPLIRAYMRRSGAPDHIGMPRRGQGPPERAEEPVRAPARARTSPSRRSRSRSCCGTRSATSRRARRPTARCAMVLTDEAGGDAAADPAWIHGTAMRSEPTMFAGPRPGEPAGRARLRRRRLRAGRHHRPARARSTWPRSTCRSPGTSRCGSRTSASPPRARAGSSTEDGRHRAWTATSRGTRRAACCRRTRSARRA